MPMSRFRSFFKDTDGAVTVDWVVLTAAVVALVAAIFTAIQTGSGDLAAETETFLTTLPSP